MSVVDTLKGKLRFQRVDDRAHQHPYGDVITVPRGFVDKSITDFPNHHVPGDRL